MQSEHDIQNEIMIALSANDCTVFRTNAGKIKTADGRIIILFPRGYPDLTGFRHSDGRYFAIEVKNDVGRLRPEQERFGRFLKNYPILYGVARSAEEALRIVEGD